MLRFMIELIVFDAGCDMYCDLDVVDMILL